MISKKKLWAFKWNIHGLVSNIGGRGTVGPDDLGGLFWPKTSYKSVFQLNIETHYNVRMYRVDYWGSLK